MADNSKIEWTDATWNPITGCAVVSPGCKHCYAMKLAGTRLRNHPSRRGLTHDTKAGPVWNGKVRLNERWLRQPAVRWRRPRKIFVCAHGDLFAEAVPIEWIDRVFAEMAAAPYHIFQVLTKRAARMLEYVSGLDARRKDFDCDSALDFIEWPLPHVWLGVSAEDQTRADERIPDLLATPAAIRFVSYEPALGPIDFTRIAQKNGDTLNALTGEVTARRSGCLVDDDAHFIDWVIAGGESGKNARPANPNWFREVRDDCAKAGVAFHFKQHGEWREPAGDEDYDTSKGRAGNPPAFIISHDGTVHCFSHLGDDDRPVVIHVGKKRAGRLLDGVEHHDERLRAALATLRELQAEKAKEKAA